MIQNKPTEKISAKFLSKLHADEFNKIEGLKFFLRERAAGKIPFYSTTPLEFIKKRFKMFVDDCPKIVYEKPIESPNRLLI